MKMPWSKRRLLRQALAQGLEAQQRENTLRGLTGWDLENLNRAIAYGEFKIVPSEDAASVFRALSSWTRYIAEGEMQTDD